MRRASAYIHRIGPAISKSGGHNTTYKVACKLLHGFGLTHDEAWQIISEWNETCDPPWSEQELDRKLCEAAKVSDSRGVGYLLVDGPTYIFSERPIWIKGRETEPAATETHGHWTLPAGWLGTKSE